MSRIAGALDVDLEATLDEVCAGIVDGLRSTHGDDEPGDALDFWQWRGSLMKTGCSTIGPSRFARSGS